MPGLNTVQCLQCGSITRDDGVVTAADGRFTTTIHDKHQALQALGDNATVPVESDVSGYQEVTNQDQPSEQGQVQSESVGSGEVGPAAGSS
jgi:hypothetical protein